MAVSNTVVKQLYNGTGALTTFAIPFAFIPSAASSMIKVYLIDNTTKLQTIQIEGAVQDYTLTPAYDPISNLNGPTNVVFNAGRIPAATKRVLVIREIAYTQVVSFISNTAALGANNLELGLDRAVLMIQQLYEQLGRAPVIQQYDEMVIPFNPELPPVEADFVLKVNALGTGFEFVSAAALIAGIPGGGGVPAGGAAGAFLEKATATDGDAIWQPGAFSGISRFGAFSSTGLFDTVSKILNITYTPPSISLSASGSGTIRERGNAVTASTLTATITRQSDPIAQVRFYLNPSTLLDTQTSGGAIPSGGASTYNWTGSFSTNTTFRAEVDDNGATGGPTTVTGTSSFTFVYPYYYGAGAPALTAAQVAALTKDIRVSTSTLAVNFTAASGNVFYFAYPASYGALTSIQDASLFETFGDWTLRTENITGLDATAQSYRIYVFNNPVVAGSYLYTFRR